MENKEILLNLIKDIEEEFNKFKSELKSMGNILVSADEKVILRNLNKDFKWIARDKNESLWVYKNKPEKGEGFWTDFDLNQELDLFTKDLFQFVRWEDDEPLKIKDLIKD